MQSRKFSSISTKSIVATTILSTFCSSSFAFDPGSPLEGLDPTNDRKITSAFDHHRAGNPIAYDGTVESFTGEVGKRIHDVEDGDCYSKQDGSDFDLDGKYKGLESLGRKFLCYDGHNGVDFPANNEWVLSVEEGTVEYVKSDCPEVEPSCLVKGAPCCHPNGNYIKIKHPDGTKSIYAHLSQQIEVSDDPPTKVTKGMRIAKSGNSGQSYSPHLHVGFYNPSGSVIDPYDYWKSESARIVTVIFEGTLDWIGPSGGNQIPYFNIGDKIWGTYDLDLDAQDGRPSDAKIGYYSGAVSNREIHIKSFDLSPSGIVPLQIGNNEYSYDFLSRIDYYLISWPVHNQPKVGNWTLNWYHLQLVDDTNSGFLSDKIPSNPPSPINFAAPNGSFIWLTFSEPSLGYGSSFTAKLEKHYILE